MLRLSEFTAPAFDRLRLWGDPCCDRLPVADVAVCISADRFADHVKESRYSIDETLLRSSYAKSQCPTDDWNDRFPTNGSRRNTCPRRADVSANAPNSFFFSGDAFSA